jgi:hypothetical protein
VVGEGGEAGGVIGAEGVYRDEEDRGLGLCRDGEEEKEDALQRYAARSGI